MQFGAVDNTILGGAKHNIEHCAGGVRADKRERKIKGKFLFVYVSHVL